MFEINLIKFKMHVYIDRLGRRTKVHENKLNKIFLKRFNFNIF